MTFGIKIKIEPGTDIKDAKKEALAFGRANGCNVDFKFNELLMHVKRNGCVLTFDLDKYPILQNEEMI